MPFLSPNQQCPRTEGKRVQKVKLYAEQQKITQTSSSQSLEWFLLLFIEFDDVLSSCLAFATQFCGITVRYNSNNELTNPFCGCGWAAGTRNIQRRHDGHWSLSSLKSPLLLLSILYLLWTIASCLFNFRVFISPGKMAVKTMCNDWVMFKYMSVNLKLITYMMYNDIINK